MSDTETNQSVKAKADEADKAKVDTSDAEDVRANAVAAMEEIEAIEPTPSQAELDRMKTGEAHVEAGKSGSYKTRQQRA